MIKREGITEQRVVPVEEGLLAEKDMRETRDDQETQQGGEPSRRKPGVPAGCRRRRISIPMGSHGRQSVTAAAEPKEKPTGQFFFLALSGSGLNGLALTTGAEGWRGRKNGLRNR